MVANRKQIGKTGEDIAANFLKGKGYRILARNFRRRMGEIDIIAQDGQTLVFVEVKTDRTGAFGEPEYRVDPRKQRQLGRLALRYLQEKGIQDQDCRFDVVAVIIQGNTVRIRHLKNAFWLEA